MLNEDLSCIQNSYTISLKNVFEQWGLIIDDYSEFAEWSVCWDREEFINANCENADPKVVSFGEFERPKEEKQNENI